MKTLPSLLWCTLAAPCALALQSSDSYGPPARSTPPAEHLPAPQMESALDDSVPLPIPAVVQANDAGDRVLEPASGDPFFLGFAAGKHYPPAGERVDPLLEAALAREFADGRPERVSWGFVMFSKRITPARLDALRLAGARVIEFHPHYTMKVALGADALARIAALDFVRWVGVPRAAQKVHPLLAAQVTRAQPGERLDV